jgi:ABC-type glycerol-3-phosphate transport system substrate-binding protein
MKKSLVLALCVAAVLAACGGGDDDAPPAATAQVPASASASAMGLIDYLKLLVSASADTLEPVDLSAVTPPADDTGGAAVVD